jgi:hypothetical protein
MESGNRVIAVPSQSKCSYRTLLMQNPVMQNPVMQNPATLRHDHIATKIQKLQISKTADIARDLKI